MTEEPDPASEGLGKLLKSLPAAAAPASFMQDVVTRSLLHKLPTLTAPPSFEADVLQRIANNATESDSREPKNTDSAERSPRNTPSAHGSDSSPVQVLKPGGAIGTGLLVGTAACLVVLSLSFYWWPRGAVQAQAESTSDVETTIPASGTQGASGFETPSTLPPQDNGATSKTASMTGSPSSRTNTEDQKSNDVMTSRTPNLDTRISISTTKTLGTVAGVNKAKRGLRHGKSLRLDSTKHEHVIRGVDVPANRKDEE